MFIQKILFGGPGVGKSYLIDNTYLQKLSIERESLNCHKIVFHPEYSYGDFIGKLLPLSVGEKVTYEFYQGHLMSALSRAYSNILKDNKNPENVLLVIDEINRGNAIAIFGSIFQLLDRENDGWSSYEVNLSKMEYRKLLELIDIKYLGGKFIVGEQLADKISGYSREGYVEDRANEQEKLYEQVLKPIKLRDGKIRLPPNLSIIATMNTSDNTIFYMDSAFKRRWDWEFIKGEKQICSIEDEVDWCEFVDKLNSFFKKNVKIIQKIEDKQIGYWFIKSKKDSISYDDIKNKLMFFVWDTVFSRNKSVLSDLLGINLDQLTTFGDFCEYERQFVENIMES